jgi:hypothetical protein
MSKRTPSESQISAVMSELGKRGGKKRAALMTPAERQASARNAIQARWRKNGIAAALAPDTESAEGMPSIKKRKA